MLSAIAFIQQFPARGVLFPESSRPTPSRSAGRSFPFLWRERFFLGTPRSYESYILPISRLLFLRVESALRGIGNDITDRRSVDESRKELLPVSDVKESEAGPHLLPQVALGLLGV